MSEGPRTPNQTLAERVRKLRGDDLSQRGLGERMRRLGHRWNDTIVSRVERGERDVSVDELVALGLILGASPRDLLTPSADVAVGDVNIERDLYAAWLEGFGLLRVGDDKELTFDNDLAMEYFDRRGMFKKESD